MEIKFTERERLIIRVCQITKTNFTERQKCQNKSHGYQRARYFLELYYSKNVLLKKDKTDINGWCQTCLKDLIVYWDNQTVEKIVKGGQTYGESNWN